MYPPRVELVPADTKLITITSAGNDINYIGAIGSNTDRTGPNTADMIQRYKTTINALKAKAPDAKIVLVEYVSLIGNAALAGPVDGVPFGLDRAAYYKGFADELAQITEQAAAGEANVWVIDVAAQSMSHGVGDADPWANGADGPRASGDRDDDGGGWHPNRRGMRAIAGMLDGWYGQNH